MYDKNRKYLMHCPKCGYEVVWDDNPLYNRIHDAKLEYNVVLNKLAAFGPDEKRKSAKWWSLNDRLAELAKELASLKSIRMSNAAYDRERWHTAFKETVKETVGPEVYAQLIERTNRKAQPMTAEQLAQNRKED